MASPVGFVLTQTQVDTINEFLGKVRRFQNNRAFETDNTIDHEEMPTPEVYMTYTPSGGIAALDESGTAGDAIPGYAECQIYRLSLISDAMEYIGTTQRVYNFSNSIISGNKWILAVRDKYGIWIAVDLSSGSVGFPVELTSIYNLSTGYPWKRMEEQSNGTFIDHPNGEIGDYAFTPDEDHDLDSGTRGWLFPNPDSIGTGTGTADQLYIFIPVYRTRTHCKNSELVFQTSIDGGVTWIDTETLGVHCGTGTGGGSEPITVGGCGWVSGLRPSDCLKLTVVEALGHCSDIDTAQSLILCYNGSEWESGQCTPGTAGTGTADDFFLYHFGEGIVYFGISSSGVPYLKIGTTFLVWDKCGVSDVDGKPVIDFSSGSDTFCGTGTANDSGCPDNYFTVRIKCTDCPTHWYCVQEGTAAVEILELTLYEATQLEAFIIAGPYQTEAEAELNCGPPIDCPNLVGTAHTLTLTVSSTQACLDGMTKVLTNSGSTWFENNTPNPCSTDTGFGMHCSGNSYTAVYNGCSLIFVSATGTHIVFNYPSSGTASCYPLSGEDSTFTITIT